MNVLLSRLTWPRFLRPAKPAWLALRRPLDEFDALEPEPPLPGCGWFDSSWELQQGLAVTECGGDAALPRDLPVSGLWQ